MLQPDVEQAKSFSESVIANVLPLIPEIFFQTQDDGMQKCEHDNISGVNVIDSTYLGISLSSRSAVTFSLTNRPKSSTSKRNYFRQCTEFN